MQDRRQCIEVLPVIAIQEQLYALEHYVGIEFRCVAHTDAVSLIAHEAHLHQYSRGIWREGIAESPP
ncbi:MAG: hypothetical protein A3J97_00215 [Spirochaetes bacterium RIFOXYC1_FULL_54_7]|nr:MAG: hypothetical protein A3J97_00215 [Spirochaetes bacterium RIFOXYC1_FULL_54_7]